jgi:DNA-binding response OmpR family regulator
MGIELVGPRQGTQGGFNGPPRLIKEIWGRALGDNVQYLRMLVRKLRQKIEVDPNQPKFLITESGVGYRLERHK